MEWNLVIDKGERKGQVIPIRVTPFVIGRDDDCQLRPASLYVSHRHCALIGRGNALVLRDCRSTNGTFVNGRKMAEVKLRPGDRLGIGPLSFIVSLKSPAVVDREPEKSEGGVLSRPITDITSLAPRVSLERMPSHHAISEEAIAALLLEMDEEETAGKGPEAGRTWRLGSSFSFPEDDAAKGPGNAAPANTPETKPSSPAEVAAAILSKKSFEWLRGKERKVIDSGKNSGKEVPL